MFKSKKVITLFLAFIMMLGNLSIAMAANLDKDVYQQKFTVVGYGYTPKWSEEIQKLNDVNTNVFYNLEEDKVDGKVTVPYNGNEYNIIFNLNKDTKRPQLYYGHTKIVIDNIKKSVSIVAEINKNKIESMSLIIDTDIAYNLGKNLKIDDLKEKAKKIKDERKANENISMDRTDDMFTTSSMETLVTTSSIDSAIRGEGSGDGLIY